MVETVRVVQDSDHTCTGHGKWCSAFYIHVLIPLIGCRVKEAPACCILWRRHTWVQTAQHGHHVVLDGTSNSEILQELGPAEKPEKKKTSAFHQLTKLHERALHRPVLHVPEDRCTAEARGNAEVRLGFGKRRQEVTAAASVLPCDQLTGVSRCETVPVWPITACDTEDQLLS